MIEIEKIINSLDSYYTLQFCFSILRCSIIMDFRIHKLVSKLIYIYKIIMQNNNCIWYFKRNEYKQFYQNYFLIYICIISMLIDNVDSCDQTIRNRPDDITIRSNRQWPIKRSNLRHLHRVPCALLAISEHGKR